MLRHAAILFAVGAVLGAVAAAGVYTGLMAREVRQQLEKDAATNRRLNDADVSTGDDDADLEWLRARGERTSGPR